MKLVLFEQMMPIWLRLHALHKSANFDFKIVRS
jgi:hypothetical protein